MSDCVSTQFCKQASQPASQSIDEKITNTNIWNESSHNHAYCLFLSLTLSVALLINKWWSRNWQQFWLLLNVDDERLKPIHFIATTTTTTTTTTNEWRRSTSTATQQQRVDEWGNNSRVIAEFKSHTNTKEHVLGELNVKHGREQKRQKEHTHTRTIQLVIANIGLLFLTLCCKVSIKLQECR